MTVKDRIFALVAALSSFGSFYPSIAKSPPEAKYGPITGIHACMGETGSGSMDQIGPE